MANNSTGFTGTVIVFVIIPLLSLLAYFLEEKSSSNNTSESKKITSVYNNYILFRVDSTDRLLINKDHYKNCHTSRHIHITVNNEVYLGKFEFNICDTLSTDYLIGEKFLIKHNVMLFVYNNEVRVLYTNNRSDVVKYKKMIQEGENGDLNLAIDYLIYFCKGRMLTDFAYVDVCCILDRVKDMNKWEDLNFLLNNSKYKDLDYMTRNQINLFFFAVN